MEFYGKEYEERYGERIMSDYQEREEQERIDTEEKIKLLEKFLGRIKDIIAAYDDGQDIIEDLKYEVENLEDEL